jgi:tripartite-type tricarboxylate transporter receptor subunit TctC
LELNPLVPVKTLAEFISYSKANAGKVNVASFGVGTSSHLAGELFKAMAGITLVHVPYRGDAPALTDAISGQVQATFSAVGSSLEYVRTGRLRALGVTTATRWEALPDVPTIAETVPGYEASTWNGVAVPRGTPQNILEKLNREINAGLSDPKVRERITDLGNVPLPLSPADIGKLLINDTEKWGNVIRALNIKGQ